MTRPAFIGPDWLRCTDGMAFVSPPPEHLRADATLQSPDPWERLACVVLQAQAGDFRHVSQLVELARTEADDGLRGGAITLLGFLVPADGLAELTRLFDHPDHDTRLEAYEAAANTCLPRAALALARHRGRFGRFESERIMDHVSDLLEPDREDLELTDSPLDDAAYVALVERFVEAIEERHGVGTAVYGGEPLDVGGLATKVAELCAEDEPEYSGGMIASLLSIVEAMSGWGYAGCLNDDCEPKLPEISHTLNSLRQSKRLDALEPGRRYFFGHPLP